MRSLRCLVLLVVAVTEGGAGDPLDRQDTLVASRAETETLLKFMLVPSLVMSGLMPYILPPIKMAAAGLGMVVNMVLFSALFSAVREYVFGPNIPQPHEMYHNFGYKPHRIRLHVPGGRGMDISNEYDQQC